MLSDIRGPLLARVSITFFSLGRIVLCRDVFFEEGHDGGVELIRPFKVCGVAGVFDYFVAGAGDGFVAQAVDIWWDDCVMFADQEKDGDAALGETLGGTAAIARRDGEEVARALRVQAVDRAKEELSRRVAFGVARRQRPIVERRAFRE